MIRLVLSDLDGTLIDADGNITEADCKAIQELKQHDIAFGIVTGRDYAFCRRLIRRYHFHDCAIIGNNGGSMWIHDKKVMEDHLEAEDAIRVFRQLEDVVSQLNPFICNEKGEFFLMKNQYGSQEKVDEVRNTLRYLGNLSDVDVCDYLRESHDSVVKISIHTYTKEKNDEWLPILQKRLPDYEVLPTSYNFIELTRKGIHKGKAIDQMLKILRIDNDDVAVIGDGINDLPMFDKITHSYAMEHAPLIVKQHAESITKNVADAIKSVILYNQTKK